MIGSSSRLAFALLFVVASGAACLADEFFYDETFFKTETVLPKLDFHRLQEIGTLRPLTLKCQTYERELREMLGEQGRDSQSALSMLNMVADIINSKQSYNHAPVVADLKLCAERANQASSFSPPASRSPLVISNLDFRGLVEAAGSLSGERKCLALEDELREQLGNFELASDALLNKVTCVVHRVGSHLANSDKVYKLLTDCLGDNLREYRADQDC